MPPDEIHPLLSLLSTACRTKLKSKADSVFPNCLQYLNLSYRSRLRKCSQKMARQFGPFDSLTASSRPEPKSVMPPEKTKTAPQLPAESLRMPLIGPPMRPPKEQIAIIPPIRRPIWAISGVVCATQAEPRGIRPPEKRPKRIANITCPARLNIPIQQNTMVLVKVPITTRTLNL